MADTEEPRPEEQDADQALGSDEEDLEEGGWPSWLSWGLVIVAAVFGGFLLGRQGGGGSQGGGVGDAEKLEVARQVAMMKQQQKIALERAQRSLEDYMRSFCREMIYVGLFRDGLGGELAKVKDDLGKAREQLGATKTKPEERLAKATDQLKQIDQKIGQLSERYDKQAMAQQKVRRVGTVGQTLQLFGRHICYFYLTRIAELMMRAQAGDQAALREAQTCRVGVGQLDPELAAQLDKRYPQLMARPGTPPTAPAAPRAPTAPASAPSTKPAP